MPIEFRCNQCGKLLRTGDDTAGRQAQCPECGALSKVPSPADTPQAPPPPAIMMAESFAPGNPFSPGQLADETRGSSPGSFLYVAPIQRVAGPATALIATAIAGMFFQALGILANLVLLAIGPAGQGPDPSPEMIGNGVQALLGIFGLAMGVVILLGAMRMKKLENYSFAVASAIIAMIPCFSPCCILGLPFGIWALVVLNDTPVKAAFRS